MRNLRNIQKIKMFRLQDTEQHEVQNWNLVAGVKLHKYFYQKKSIFISSKNDSYCEHRKRDGKCFPVIDMVIFYKVEKPSFWAFWNLISRKSFTACLRLLGLTTVYLSQVGEIHWLFLSNQLCVQAIISFCSHLIAGWSNCSRNLNHCVWASIIVTNNALSSAKSQKKCMPGKVHTRGPWQCHL